MLKYFTIVILLIFTALNGCTLYRKMPWESGKVTPWLASSDMDIIPIGAWDSEHFCLSHVNYNWQNGFLWEEVAVLVNPLFFVTSGGWSTPIGISGKDQFTKANLSLKDIRNSVGSTLGETLGNATESIINSDFISLEKSIRVLLQGHEKSNSPVDFSNSETG
jgi:hypothetical protein